MTIQTMEAVYEHVTFRLAKPPSFPLQEGQRVRIAVDADAASENILALATSVFDGLSEQELQEIDEISR